MLGVVDTEPEMTLITGSSNCTVSRCAFRYTDGSAIETFGSTNTIENCYFYHIDYTVTDLSSVMTTIRMGGSNNVFRQNTLHRTGASSGINPGNISIVEYNDMYDTGYLQSDGAIVHLMEPQQPGSETRYNWFHDSPKYGVRFDGDGVADGDAGSQGTMHHNVSWNIKTGHMVKGHHHFVYNNTSFDTEKNSIVILIDMGGNEGTITRNNAADKIAGHRSDTYQNYPVPGIYDHNWNGYETGGDVKDLLISPPAYENVEDYNPDEYDFRPNPDSELIDAGMHVEGITDGYVGSAPDLGAYEYGGENWTPGVTWDVSSYQLGVYEQRNTETLPKAFHLQQNYPNPFNSRTQIRFNINHPQQIRLSVHSITGQLINTILNKFMVDGHYIIEWNPVGISTGIYFIRMESENGVQIKKCLLLK